jgi:PST family polysaccharide transporter
MNYNNLKEKARGLIRRNSKVVENYFFMTLLQVCSPLIGLLLYPYLIRVLGPNNYGLYILTLSIANYFTIIVAFGFSWMGLKDISQNKENIGVKSHVFSTIFTAKLILSSFVFLIFFLLIVVIPFFANNKLMLLLCFLQTIIPEILFPIWYFQGIQKMRVVTVIQLVSRILTIPFVFLFIHNTNDVTIYALIVAVSLIAGSIISIVYLLKKEKVRFQIISFSEMKNYFLRTTPFFWAEAVGVGKQESVTILIGSFLNLHDIALYDLANKIINIPRLITSKINGAIFPKLIENPRWNLTKRLIIYEIILSGIIIAFLAAFGYWIVFILGGKALIGAYPVLLILSISIFNSLVVGAINNFIFIPAEKYSFVAYTQLIGFISFFIISIPLIFIWHSIFSIISAIAIAAILEIIYCFYRLKTSTTLRAKND